MWQGNFFTKSGSVGCSSRHSIRPPTFSALYKRLAKPACKYKSPICRWLSGIYIWKLWQPCETFSRRPEETGRVGGQMDDWKMSFNPSKCSTMQILYRNNPPTSHFIFCDQELQQVDSHPYLGIDIDNKMTWMPTLRMWLTKPTEPLTF